MKRLLLFLSMILLVGGTTMAFANGANGSALTRVSNNENGASTNAVVQPQNNNVGVKPLETTNNEPVITFTTNKKIGERIRLMRLYGLPLLSKSIKIEGATLVEEQWTSYVLTAQTVKIIGNCTSLDCSENDITSIDLSNNSGLTSLDCGSNQLTSLDLPNNSKLTSLSCGSNQLASLDLSNNSGLEKLWCFSNQLTSLDLTNSKNIVSIRCQSNKITQIKLPKDAEKLSNIKCESNNIDVEHMEQLINSLPERTGYRYYEYDLTVQSSSTDGNQITREQAQKAKAKDWRVKVIKYTTPTAISTIDNADASPRKVFDLNGCEVNENQAKGVVIVKQGHKTYKKVVK